MELGYFIILSILKMELISSDFGWPYLFNMKYVLMKVESLYFIAKHLFFKYFILISLPYSFKIMLLQIDSVRTITCSINYMHMLSIPIFVCSTLAICWETDSRLEEKMLTPSLVRPVLANLAPPPLHRGLPWATSATKPPQLALMAKR